MPIVQNIYGTPGSDAATYSVADVAINANVDDAKLLDIAAKCNQERVRRGYGNLTYSISGEIEAADLNSLVSAINTAGYTSGFGGVSVTANVKALDVNKMIDKLQAAGAVCLCNCNYCTCNCNYCTCNCNYACTCNCNYSDERLKTEITYL